MPYAVIEALSVLTGLGLVGSFVLIGFRMRMRHKENLAGRADHDEVDRLADAVEALTEQVEHLTGETADLQDRLDFAERLLAKPRTEVESPSPTPS